MSEFIVPDGIRDRIETLTNRRRDVWVVAAFVAVVAAGALVVWSRSGAPVVAPPAVASSQANDASTHSAQPTVRSEASATLYIHVAGAVRRPGLYEVPEGSRVADALDVARGPLRRADLDVINLAEIVADGTQIYVPRRGESAVAGGVGGSASSPGGPDLVDINSADQPALETIPGIGPVKAAAIIEYRESSGPFESVEELIEVTGIGPATLESMRAYVAAG